MLRLAWKPAKPSIITLADRARDAGHWELAARHYRTALARNPKRPTIWVQYGHALKEAGYLTKAEQAYRTAISHDPRFADAYLHLGHILKSQGRHEEARSQYLRALAADPSLDNGVLELAGFGSSTPHSINGTRTEILPSTPLAVINRKRRGTRLGHLPKSRFHPAAEDLALISPYFESNGIWAQINEDRFEIFGPGEYLSRPELWSCSPHYLFDPDWYLKQFSEPFEAQTSPFVHYLRVGIHQGRTPHPLFDPQYYLGQWKRHRPGAVVHHVFDHYLNQGARESISPHLLFSSARYRELYLENETEDVDPLKHYLTDGYRHWHNPHPLFDEGWYRDQATNLDHHTPGLVDYIARGSRLGFDPHPLFRTRYLTESSRELSGDKTPLEAYLLGEIDGDPHPLFSTCHYMSQWHGPHDLTPLEHYLEQGWREGFDPHPFFRTDWYLRLSMDISERRINPLLHYEKVGRRQGKRPNPFFDPTWYATRFMQREPMLLPEEHYLTTGLAYDLPGRETTGLHSGNLIRLRDCPQIPVAQAARLPHPLPRRRVGVFLHAFYPELVEEIFRYANNIPEPCTNYISTDTPLKAQTLGEIAKRCLRHPFEIRVLPNRGRDIAPWLVGFRDRMLEIDIGIHLHTKKSPHAKSGMDAWRRYLLDGLLGSPETVAAHLKILDYKAIGATLLEHFYPLIRVGEVNWGHNFELVRNLLRLCNLEISDQTPLEFPSGSMFWFKPEALAPLLDLDLRFEMFEPETGAVDGTLAHAIERSFLYIVEASGYGWVQVSSERRQAARFADSRTLDLVSFLANGGMRLIPTARVPSTLRRLMPIDLLPFNPRASTVDRPRINLVVPTIDQTLGYAGLTNAFELFFNLINAFGTNWDARVLGTGHDPTVRFSPPEGFTLVELGEFDWPGRSVMCNATQRGWRLIDLRRNDFFLATAWQTAHITALLCEEQSKMFNMPQQKFIYFIQDYEPPFHPWSSLFYMADATYQRPERFHAVLNTEILATFFKNRKGIEGLIYHPGLNPKIASNINRQKKLRNCLIYYRTHAVRNCHELCEIIIEELVNRDPRYYARWRFLAVGEGAQETIISGSYIERRGRLSLEEYAKLMSRSAVGLSLMVSPHPSYPPLEMAAAGMLVLANTYGDKDLSQLHDNIVSWRSARISDAVDQLDALCRAFDLDNEVGWEGKNKRDWFFTPTDNMHDIASALAESLVRQLCLLKLA